MSIKNSGGAGSANGGAGSEQNHEDQDLEQNTGEQNDEGTEGSGSGDGTTSDGRGKDRFKRDLGKLKDENKSLKEKLRLQEEAKLKEENRWKDLAERNERERDEALQKHSTSESTFKNTLKHSKIEQAAVKAGLREDAVEDLSLLDFEDVEVEETDSGRYLVRGADKAIERLKKSKPHWFKSTEAPKFNGGGGKGGGTGDAPISAEEVDRIVRKYGTNDPRSKKAWNDFLKSKQKPSGK